MRMFHGQLFVGFQWVSDGTGYCSRRSAIVASWHHRRSITWRWALYWHRPRCWSRPLGALHLATQAPMWRRDAVGGVP